MCLPAFKTFPNRKAQTPQLDQRLCRYLYPGSEDSLFAVIGRKFIQTQTRLFGTDHLYSADTFNENEPPSDDPAFLAALSRRLYKACTRPILPLPG
jgi:alpha-N-acetylglucosaminidase